jgi:hypothetical protein
MAWHKLTHLASGQVIFVDGINLANPDDYAVVAITEDRKPEGLEQVADDGSIFVPLAAAQAAAWASVKARRAQLETSTAPTLLGARVQIDEPSKAKIMGLLNMARLAEEAEQPFVEQFTMADNSVVALTNVTVRQLALAAAQYVSEVYAHARALRAAIDAAATVEDLAAIDLEAGWPE